MMNNENVKVYNQAWERFSRRNYGWHNDHHTKDSDRLVMFTTEIQAQEESTCNLERLKIMGRAYNQRYLVINRQKFQFLGSDHLEPIRHAISRDPWYERYAKEHNDRAPDMITDVSGQGGVLHVRAYNHALVLKSHYGVYDLESGQRIRNRKDIIQRFWEYGFATWRGRPPTVASLRWSGPRPHLEHLAQLANQYFYVDSSKSEVARKLVSVYSSINRYAAWPGAW